MSYRITVTPHFLNVLKALAPKCKTIKLNLAALGEELRTNPNLGRDLGHRMRKIRLSLPIRGKGRKPMSKVINYNVILMQVDKELKLITIYESNVMDD